MREFLAVDVGGTKCELALFRFGDTSYQPRCQKRYASGDYASVEDVIGSYFHEFDVRPHVVALGVAGPIEDGVAKVTNLPWTIKNTSIQERFDFDEVLLINDLTAVCASLSSIDEKDKLCLHSTDGAYGDVVGVVAPGTGLGEGYLVENSSLFMPQGCEGGHTDFGPTNKEQVELLVWMQKKVSPVSYEDLIAGPGIPNLFDFFVECKGMEVSPEVTDLLQHVTDRTPVIVEGAFGDAPCPACRKSVELFLQILGSELGNLAIKIYATGGMFIGGGIVPRLVGKIDFDQLVSAYLDKGKMEKLVRSIPLYLINRSDAALIGVARYANHLLS